MESGLSSQALTVISLHLCAFAHTWHKGMDVIAGDFGSRPHNSRVAGIHVPDRGQFRPWPSDTQKNSAQDEGPC
jgi:hypothetical protein